MQRGIVLAPLLSRNRYPAMTNSLRGRRILAFEENRKARTMTSLRFSTLLTAVVLAVGACGADGDPRASTEPPGSTGHVEATDEAAADLPTTVAVPATSVQNAPGARTDRSAPVQAATLRLEATGQPWQWGEVGPRVEPGEQEVTAYATGLRADTAVRWCAKAPKGACFVQAGQRTDSKGRSVFRFIVPPSVAPMPEAVVTVAYRASGREAARAPFAIVANTNASCPEGAPNCTPSQDCDEACRRGLEECTGPDAAALCPDGF